MNALEMRNLPDEMWAEIFWHLRVNDRKSVRLCCRRFYEICNRDRMLEDERIVFQGNFNSGPALASLSSSDRRIWNMELRQVRLDNAEDRNSCLRFFRHQGPKVRSLTFYKCSVPKLTEFDLVASVVTSCPYLREIHFVFAMSFDAHLFYEHFVDALKVLTDSKVVRGTVETFTLKVPRGLLDTDKYRLTNGDFLRMFDVFPNIANLRLFVRVGDHFNGSDTKLTDADVDSQDITWSCIRNRLLQMQLLKLHLYFIGGMLKDGLPAQWRHQSGDDIEAPALKELSLNWFCFWVGRPPNPFPRSQHLTHFDCLLPPTLCWTFVPRLLEAATELRTLKVRTYREFWISEECFRALVTSRLATLAFYLYWVYCTYECVTLHSCARVYYKLNTVNCESASFDSSIAPNRTLRRLKMDEGNSQTWYLFARYFTNLENFHCRRPLPPILFPILENLPNLSDLVLDDCNWFETALQQGNCDSPSYRLDNVERLKIGNTTLVASECFLAKFVLPKLKSLEIREAGENKNINLNALLLVIGKLSGLESLDIRCKVESSFQRWLDLVNALPKLRSLIMSGVNSRELGEKECRYLFGVRLSLRMVGVITADLDDVYYLKDILTNSVEKRNSPEEGHTALPPFTVFV